MDKEEHALIRFGGFYCQEDIVLTPKFDERIYSATEVWIGAGLRRLAEKLSVKCLTFFGGVWYNANVGIKHAREGLRWRIGRMSRKGNMKSCFQMMWRRQRRLTGLRSSIILAISGNCKRATLKRCSRPPLTQVFQNPSSASRKALFFSIRTSFNFVTFTFFL